MYYTFRNFLYCEPKIKGMSTFNDFVYNFKYNIKLLLLQWQTYFLLLWSDLCYLDLILVQFLLKQG